MEFSPAPSPLLGTLVTAIALCSGQTQAQESLWTHTGGGFASGGGLTGMVGQMPPTGGSDLLRAGFLVHPAFVNLPPLAQDTAMELLAGAQVSIALGGEDVDGRVVDARVVKSPSHATAKVSQGLLELKVDAGYQGSDSVGFVVLDDQGASSDTAWVRLSVKDGTSSLVSRPNLRKVTAHEVRLHKVMAHLAETGPSRGLVLGREASDPSGASVSLYLSGPASVQVQIYDNLGTLVTHAQLDLDDRLWTELSPTGDGRRKLTARWDLRDGAGRTVAVGVYLWKIQVVGKDGQKLETIRKTGVKP